MANQRCEDGCKFYRNVALNGCSNPKQCEHFELYQSKPEVIRGGIDAISAEQGTLTYPEDFPKPEAKPEDTNSKKIATITFKPDEGRVEIIREDEKEAKPEMEDIIKAILNDAMTPACQYEPCPDECNCHECAENRILEAIRSAGYVKLAELEEYEESETKSLYIPGNKWLEIKKEFMRIVRKKVENGK